MKIGIMGTHGTGKSTLALKLAAEYKHNHPDMNVGLLTEITRESPFPRNKDTTIEGQLWIWHAQFKKELEMTAQYEILVCDRTVLDNLAYSRYAGFNILCDDYFYSALNWLDTYDALYWLRPGKELVADGFRDSDPIFQADIDAIFKEWINKYHINVIPSAG